MVFVVFVLGRPGSGKSRAARWLNRAAQLSERFRPRRLFFPIGWEIQRFTDYIYLQRLFQKELEPGFEGERRFEACEKGGFRVLDFDVLREALEQINAEICAIKKEHVLVIVEFARGDYCCAESIWQAFDPAIIEQARYLYMKADLDKCVERVEERVSGWCPTDNVFVPKDILKGYYHHEGEAELVKYFGADKVTVIENNDLWLHTWLKIKDFVRDLDLTPVTDPLPFYHTPNIPVLVPPLALPLAGD